MKKKLLIIFLALFTGGILAFFTLNKRKNPESFEVFVLQTGVYKNLENALSEKEKLEDAIILEDDIYYRVIVGASTHEEGIVKLENILQEKNIPYYRKKMTIYEEDGALWEKYNLLLEKATSKETITLLNQKMLERLEVS